MSLKFNINRPGISDEEISKHQNFSELVERFKQQSLKKARGDESWWRNKKVRYSTVIAGLTVVCTITYFSLFKNQKETKTNETLITQNRTPTTAKTRTAFINAPAQKLKSPHSSYKINNAKGGDITHGTSSKIKIPRNSFVDKNGKDIVGDVTIEYQEFHDLGDVIASGIPMSYDSAGKQYHLETAGMFDIKGSQDGEPVFIKPEKSLQVELASAKDEQRFNQYYLDTLERNWKYIQRDHAAPVSATTRNPAHSEQKLPESKKLENLKHEIETVIPRKMDSVKVVYTHKIEKLPQPKEPAKPVASTPGRPTFQLDGSYDDFPELAAFDNVIFEVGTENKNYSKELHDITWSDVKISQGPIKGKNYLLTLIYRDRSEKLIVYPVLSGNDLVKAEKIYTQKLEKYEELVEKKSADEKRLMAEMEAKQAAYLADQKKKQEAYEKEKAAMLAKYNVLEQNDLASNFNVMSFPVKAIRLFQVSKFGTYNSDCPHPAPDGVSILPMFVTAGKKTVVYPEQIYLVDHKNSLVYALSKSDGFRISYDPKGIYSICIFNKNKMYLCRKSMFREAVEAERRAFAVEPLPEGADNLADFKKALEII